MSAPLFEADRVTRRYREVPVVDEVSLTVAAGEIVALLGPNGAGKTTLIRMAATLARPSSGTVRYRGVELKHAVPAARGWIGFASHQSLLYPELTVRENLNFHRRLHGARTDIGALLETHGLAPVADVPARHLSRGTAQRATLARALLHQPDLLLLDEPFAGLDGAARERLAGMVRAARERGAAVLFATHDVGRAVELADRALVLQRGRVVLDDPAADPEAVGRTYDAAAAGRDARAAGRDASRGGTPQPRGGTTAGPEQPSRRPKQELRLVTTFRAGMAIAGKDLLSEARSRERLPAMLLFAALVLLVMHLAIGLDSADRHDLAPGVLQAAFLFAGTLGLYRSFAPETEAMAIHGLMLGPVDRSAIYFGKLASGTLLLLAVEIPVVALYQFFFRANLLGGQTVNGLLTLGAILLCGSLGFMALGVTVAAICAATPVREVLLPLLLFPLSAPLLIAGVSGMRAAMAGEPVWDAARFLILSAVAFVSVSWMVFEFALEE